MPGPQFAFSDPNVASAYGPPVPSSRPDALAEPVRARDVGAIQAGRERARFMGGLARIKGRPLSAIEQREFGGDRY